MSHENGELIRRTILAWNDHRVEALVKRLDRDLSEDQPVESVEVIDVNDDALIAVVNGFARTPHFDARSR